MKIFCQQKSNKREITSRDVRQKNLNSLNEELTTLIPKLQPNTDTNSQFNDFHALLQTAIQNHCPVVTRKVAKNKFRREPWMTHGLLISSHKQKTLYQATLKNNCTISSVIKYKDYRNLLTKLKHKCKIGYYKDKCKAFKHNVK